MLKCRKKRDFRRELAQELIDERNTEGKRPEPVDGQARTPEAIVEVAEEVEQLLSALPGELREVAVLRIEGFTAEEIAERINRTLRTVERRMERIRDLWSTLPEKADD